MQQTIMKHLRIGDVLRDYGYVTERQIEDALAYQKENPDVRLGSALIALGYISEQQMLRALGERLHLRQVKLTDLNVDLRAVQMIPRKLAEKYCAIPVGFAGESIRIVINDPLDFYAEEDIRQITGMQVELLLCDSATIRKAVRYYYAEADALHAANKVHAVHPDARADRLTPAAESDDAPIIQLLKTLVQRAYSTGASDIHIEPFQDKTLIRMRIDGTITHYMELDPDAHSALIARIKILSELDIAERRLPQDGHFRMELESGLVNIRVSVIPTVFGEKAVLRLLESNSVIERAESFGMQPEDYGKMRRILRSPHGIIYLTGPTGSGKTTTLYMILEEMARRQVNISTIEDPVERNIMGVNQMQVNNQAGLTFGTGLRALLRQDPDVIMVGETRDAETASISARAAITGHLVFSTLHTNDAASSIVRLEDMGLERYLVASSVVGIVAQRLMRRVCPYCSTQEAATAEEELLLGGPAGVRRAHGCKFCNQTGYRGRMAVHEILVVDKPVRAMINAGATVDEIQAYAVEREGMTTLRDAAAAMARSGVTTADELMKVAFYA